jgi:hypothetical protein
MRLSVYCLGFSTLCLAACETNTGDTGTTEKPINAGLPLNTNNNAGLVTPPPAGDAAKPGDPGPLPVLPAGLVLPAGWQGLGVLANAAEPAPSQAPGWAKSQAEVVARDGKHFLETTGRADRIKNPALARSTAENRARAELAKWLNVDKVSGGEVVNMYVDKKSKAMLIRVAIEVPEGWFPGQPAVGFPPPAPAPVP